MSCQGFLPINQRLGDGVQVVGDDAPADPALHPVVAMVATALQLVAAFQPADPPFDASPPVAALSKPALTLVCCARSCLARSLGQYHPAHTALPGQLLIRCGRHLAI